MNLRKNLIENMREKHKAWLDRCDWCSWPLAENAEDGCVPGNCADDGAVLDVLDELDAADYELVGELNIMIRHISAKNSFPKHELIELLKRVRDRIDPEPALLRRQGG